MSADTLAVVGIAVAWSGSAGCLGLLVTWLMRRWSLRWLTVSVAAVGVLTVLAGVVGTARAMFLSPHDFGVVLLVSAVAGCVALAAAMAVGSTLVRVTGSLHEGARRFGETGRFSTRPGGPAEFTRLSLELQRTSDRLRESREAESRLETSRRQLVSWVSHDLRTPLAGLRAMTEALQDGLAEDPERFHRQMKHEVDRMVRMVDDLFELSRIHSGVLKLTLESIALGDLVSDSVATAGAVAKAKGVRLVGSVDNGLLVRADAGELSRAMANLVMNAIRHTPADGVVAVEGRAVPQGVELRVSDACGGIPDHELAHVFDIAWRGSHARTPRPDQGAGLGLAIVKGIAEAHRGTVEVRNQDDGCTFLLRLPV